MRRVTVVAFLGALAAAGAVGQPAGLENARVTVVAAQAGGPARQIQGLAGGASPRWIGWAAPAEDSRRQMCCGDWGRNHAACCGRCALEHDGSSFMSGTGKTSARLEPPGEFLLLVRVTAGKTERLRHFSPDCRIDAGGMPVVWLQGVSPEESVAWLETLARATNREDDDSEESELVDAAIAGIALHAGPAAEAALLRRIARQEPAWVREKAAFWLAAARGRAGCATLRTVVPRDPEETFREHGTFALSLCDRHGGVETLLEMARRDPAGDVRAQALFWLAQKAGQKAANAIDGAIRDDPDTEVKKRAVFALTQMPDGEGVPELIRVARSNRNPEVREQAVFWLGQSKDPRALDFIEQILTK